MAEEKQDRFGLAMVPNTDPHYLLQKRNVDPLRKTLQESLSGITFHEIQEGKQWKIIKEKIDDPKMNMKGVQSVMLFFDMIVNSQTVMGNITRDELGVILHDARVNLSNTLWVNAIAYDLNLNHYHEIIGNVMNCIRLFLTRPIDNKERESDGQSVKVMETNFQGKRSGSKNIPGLVN